MEELELKVNDLYGEINQLNEEIKMLKTRFTMPKEVYPDMIKLRAYSLINDICTSDDMIDSCEFRHYVEGVNDMVNQLMGGDEECQ